MGVPGGTVVITGGSGLTGAAAALMLHKAYDVVAFDRAGPPHPPPGIETVNVDLTDAASVREGLRTVRQRHGPRIASFLHFAAYYSFSGEPSPLYEEINVRGTERLLDALGGFEV